MKKTLALFLTLAMTVFVANGCSAQDISEITTGTKIILTINRPTILVNGVEQSIDEDGTVPVILNDRTFLPIRAVVEAMNGTVEWDNDSKTVTLRRSDDTIRLVIGSETAYVNDAPKTLNSAPVIINHRTMLPIRFIAESFRFSVEWDVTNQRVVIAEPPMNPTTTKPIAQNENQITVIVGTQNFTATLEDNETARAFYEMLPLTLDMDEMNGNEKYAYLDESLPSNSRHISEIRTGDLMLYGSNCLVSFFKTFSTPYTYTPIGHINNVEGYEAALSSGSVTITFSK